MGAEHCKPEGPVKDEGAESIVKPQGHHDCAAVLSEGGCAGFIVRASMGHSAAMLVDV